MTGTFHRYEASIRNRDLEVALGCSLHLFVLMLNFELLLLAVFLLILRLLLLQCPRSKMPKNLERMHPPVHAPAVLQHWALDVYLLPLTSAAPVTCKTGYT